MADESQEVQNQETAQTAAPAAAEQTAPTAEDQTQTESQGASTAKAPEQTSDNLMGDTLLGSGDQAAEEGETQLKEQETTQGAPEAYETFRDVNGNEYAPESVQQFADAAKSVGLSQESAQKLFEAMVPTARAHMMNDLRSKAEQWALDCEKDPEIGGANFGANKAVAISGYREFATPELRTILNASGLGNHPEVVRHFFRLGKTLQQDSGVHGNASANPPKRRRYPNSNMVVDE